MGSLPRLATLYLNLALVKNYQTVPAGRDRVAVALIGLNVEIYEKCRSASNNGTPHAEDLPSHNLRLKPITIIVQRDRVRLELLVLRRAEFVLRLKVDPQLEAV